MRSESEAPPPARPFGMPRPPTHLDDFLHWLEGTPYDSLRNDVLLLRYLDLLPQAPHSRLRIRQLGSTLTLQHDGLGARGTIRLPQITHRLQHALVNYTLALDPLPALPDTAHERQDREVARRLSDAIRGANFEASQAPSPPPSLL